MMQQTIIWKEFEFDIDSITWDNIQPRLEKRINQVGIKQNDLAKKMGTTQQNIQKQIKGAGDVSCKLNGKAAYRQILKYAEHLGCTIEYLLGYVDEPDSILISPSFMKCFSHDSIKYISAEQREMIRTDFDKYVEEWKHKIKVGQSDSDIFPRHLIKKLHFRDKSEKYEKISNMLDSKIEDDMRKASDMYVSFDDDGMYFCSAEQNIVYFLPGPNNHNVPPGFYKVLNPKFHYPIPSNLNTEYRNNEKLYAHYHLGNIMARINPDPMFYESCILFLQCMITHDATDFYKLFVRFITAYSSQKRLVISFFNLMATHLLQKDIQQLELYLTDYLKKVTERNKKPVKNKNII